MGVFDNIVSAITNYFNPRPPVRSDTSGITSQAIQQSYSQPKSSGAAYNLPFADMTSSTSAPSAQMRGMPSQYSSTSPGFGALSDSGSGTQYQSRSGSSQQGPSYTSGSSNPSSPTPFRNPDGSDTLLGMLVKIGKDMNPIQKDQYQRELAAWYAAHPSAQTIAPRPAVPLQPTLPPAQMSMVRSTTGATTQPDAVSSQTRPGGAVSLIQNMGNFSKQALQKAKSAVLSGKAAAFPILPAAGIGLGALQTLIQHPEALGALPASELESLLGGMGRTGELVSKLPSSIQAALSEGERLVPRMTKTLGKGGALAGLGAAIFPWLQQVEAYIRPTGGQAELTQKPARQGNQLTVEKKTGLPATTQYTLGTQNASVRQQAIKEVGSGTNKIATNELAMGIATSEALPEINKEMDKAQKTGNMEAVQRLSNLYTGVQRQIQFNNILQQAIMAIAGGFGSPQAAGVTAARIPMIQQAAGAQLEAPLPTMAQIPQGQEGAQIPYLPPNLMSAPTVQQNKPVINPYMG